MDEISDKDIITEFIFKIFFLRRLNKKFLSVVINFSRFHTVPLE